MLGTNTGKIIVLKAAGILAAFTVYIIVFILLYPVIEGAVATMGLFPVIISGLFFGRIAGVAAACGILASYSVLFPFFGAYNSSFPVEAIPTNLAILFTGVSIGWLRDMHLKMKKQARILEREIEKRKETENALREEQNSLERRVDERTKELKSINRILTGEVSERRETEKKLKASLDEKAILIKEIHHRVKNNLQIVSSLLNLQANSVDDSNISGLFQESQMRVRSIALVHENLYQSSSLARIKFDVYLKRLLDYLSKTYTTTLASVEITVDVHDIELGIDQTVPCGLIVNELVSNVFKHAFNEKNTGKITIQMDKLGGKRYVLTVKDNGIGLPEDFDIKDNSSLGMYLIHSLSNQMNGTVEISGQNGTTVKVFFEED